MALVSRTFTLAGTPTLIAVGQPHCVLLTTLDTGITVGGTEDECTFPVYETNAAPTEITLAWEKEELWADGTGDLEVLEVGLSLRTPSVPA